MSRDHRVGVTNAVAELLSEMSGDPHGVFSPSVYETARLVRFTPSLRGHIQRVRFLIDHQSWDGGWGGPDEYGLAPTLSATEALLTVLRNLPQGEEYEKVIRSVDAGLRWLFVRLNARDRVRLPDTVAVEIIVPGLIMDINAQLDRLDREPLPGLGWRYSGHRLHLPDGADDELLSRLRGAVADGHRVPSKLLHSLEVIGAGALEAPWIEPIRGVVGCSPAATAAWLGDRRVQSGRHPSVRYLEAAQRRGSSVPVATPLAVFERAWVLSTLAGAGLIIAAPHSLIRTLRAALGIYGAAGGPGLPPDADDTATVLSALARLGSPRSPECLWTYQQGSHFACFPAERTPSSSTNAHVLQAFGVCLRPALPGHARYVAAMTALTRWLREQQQADGSWRDKWHASPYYATLCCATALADHGGSADGTAVGAAVDWILDTQQPDGSWGRWAGTYEETAYAIQLLLRAEVSRGDGVIESAAARGCAALLRTDPTEEHPPLWHDKDLYTPLRIIRAEGLAALHLAGANPRVAALIAQVEPTCRCTAGCQA